ncbi:MAG: YDG domain-containing protein [Undibacterium sp.]|uniref:two-partner secretion domain-containing protein n=1 Tax=Undibacterium sp. TaxID=1914977 RepID=UPI0027202E99|nr:YDG domain-containing protein [Undibacterium sp.]MDO8653313.1 YDG domain-containing protein [Undibacterium sp.]
MNCIYRSIWNHKTRTFVAVSESTKSAGKKTSSGASATGSAARFCVKALAMSVMMAFGATAYAGPVGGVVQAGAANINTGVGGTTINQSTSNVVINWQSFNIAPNETVRFVQPGSSSVALNRVIGADSSNILGNLIANGKVFLVNPNGVLFGKSASVNVGGLVASTLNIADSDFMAGTYKFSGTASGTVLNQGSISTNADGGYIALMGANVGNDGVISAKLGTVALAAGKAITLDLAGDGLVNITVNQGTLNSLVQNGGLIQADGGQVLLTTQAAGTLLQSVVNNTGVIRAQTLENHNGTIRLLGDMQSGTVSVGGTLDASGTGTGQTGGNVTVTGQHVGLFGGHINASGDAGGGTVLIGGDYQGKNPSVPNATATYMSADASITADAITNGNGGKVVLWADDSTRAYGSIRANGGTQGGDGGLIETSGHNLDVAGIKVDTRAPNGKYGMWLLDPADVTITGAASSPSFSGGNPNVFSPSAGASTANVAVSDITTALLTTGVTINTVNTGAAGVGSGDITIGTPLVAAPIIWTAPTTLTLNAVRNVTVNSGSAITATDGSFVVNAGGNIDVKATTKTTTGNLSYKAVGNVNMDAATTITTGTVSVIAGGNVTVNNAMTVTTGDIVLRGDNDGTGPGAVVGGTVNITCGSNCLTIGTGTLRIRFNPASYATTGAEITNYGTTLTGGGALDAKAWVFGKGDNKIYDGTTAATVNGLKPDLAGVAPAATLGVVTNANFDTKHVGTNKLITFDSTFSDAVYDLFAPFGTTPGTYTTRADVFVRPLTVNAVTDTRVYNGTTSSVGTPTVIDLQAGDTLNGTLTQAYASKNVLGTNNSTLVATGPYTVSDGNGGNNYSVTVNTAPGTITPLALVGSITAANKMYDGDNTATIVTRTLATPVAGDAVSYIGGSALFSDKNVADGKTVTGTGLSLAGADAGNYTVNTSAITTANITPAPLTLKADNASKVYGQTFTPASTAFTIVVAPVAGETVTNVSETSPSGTPATASVAGSPHPITITPGSATGTFDPSNYNIIYLPGTLTVTPAPLTVKANDTTKVYGQTFTPSSTAFTTPVALQNGETVGSVTETSPTGTPATASAVGGPYPITPSNATGGTFTPSNYTITYVNGLLTVTPVVVPPVTPPVVVSPPDVVPPPVIVPPPDVVSPPDVVAPPDVVSPPVIVPPPVVVAPPDVVSPPVIVPPPVVVSPPDVVPPPVIVPPKVYVAPYHPPKQDRN